ncbi:hypothetical protein L1987_63276 [Smallanthus sonchifolius]|uniref:Uncharacterized protein n=1 Tax=Smallanthus sonchifolius TaxID=185202 RepID=A0ACB9CCS2_9ASTR|nr:hypothetical protein L1987_63276 [Smallanthus sonchifolius]
MITPLAREIEKYIGGLPMQIQDAVLGSNPPTLEAAIRLSAMLSDNHVKSGTLSRKGSKKVVSTLADVKYVRPESSNRNKKRKGRNFAAVTPTVPAIQVAPLGQNPKPYMGPNPNVRPENTTILPTYHADCVQAADDMDTWPLLAVPVLPSIKLLQPTVQTI